MAHYLATFGSVVAEIGALMNKPEIMKISPLIDEGCSATQLSAMLKLVQSPAARELHMKIKQFDVLREVHTTLRDACQEQFKLSDPAMASEIAELDTEQEAAHNANGTHAVIQALTRPLKPEETRSGLARRARLLVLSRKVTLPANLSLLLNHVAGANEAGGDGGEGAAIVAEQLWWRVVLHVLPGQSQQWQRQ